MTCGRCGIKPSSPGARFCSKCGGELSSVRRHWSLTTVRVLVFPLVLVGRALTYPMRRRRERIRWLTEASSADSPVNHVPGLSDGAKRVYVYLADVTLRFGSSHSRVGTIARAANLSEHKARAAIRELERKGLLSHETRNTWHGRGAHSYKVRPENRHKERP